MLLDRLSGHYDINVYDFTKETPDLSCPFDSSGGIQIWDLLQAKNKITEEVVIKLRTDLWFTKTSIDVMMTYIKKVMNDELDIVFLGLDFIRTPHKICVESPVEGTKKIVDFVVVSRRSGIADDELIYSQLSNAQFRSGNQLFKILPRAEARSLSVSCQIYLLRKEYPNPDNWQIYKEWTDLYKNKPKSSHAWVADNKDIVGTF
jgi:hypothetical protein